MADQKLFDEVRHYGKIVRDDEVVKGSDSVRTTWFIYSGNLYITVRKNGELFFVKEYKNIQA